MERKNLAMTQPLVIAYGYSNDADQMTFIGYGKEITVEGCNEVLSKLLPLCNGVNRFEDILGKLKNEYARDSLSELIKTLLENEVLIDSRDFYWVFHRCSMNPTLYFRELSENNIAAILRRKNHKSYKKVRRRIFLPSSSEIESGFLEFIKARQSVYKYTAKNFSFTKLSGLVKAAYGVIRKEYLGSYTIPHRTVPSGGALYPLELYIITLVDIEKLKRGLYYFQKEKEYLVPLKIGNFREGLKELLFEVDEVIETASLFLIVTVRFFRGCEKYSNRGYRNILLEAGHLAQNVYLYCIDQNLDTVELSAFWDAKLAHFLEINIREEAPITVLAIGTR